MTNKPKAVSGQTVTEQTETELIQAFRNQTFLHAGAIYSDALCLTGSGQEAVELTAQTYTRAFRDYVRFQNRQTLGRLETATTLPWLRCHMHAVFCGGILAKTRRPTAQKGEQG